MENKCNKTPNANNKYMDHVYCHPTESKNYIRASNNAGGGGGAASVANTDYLALIKENKQLRAMLILHLDLIQAQSDQLQVKDKQLATQNEEIDGLRSKNQQLETQVQELQKQLQRHIKRTANSPPPLAKIQRKAEPMLASRVSPVTAATVAAPGGQNIIGECNGKLISKIILHRVSMPDHSPNSTTTGTSDSTSEADDSTTSKTHAEQDENDDYAEDDDDGDLEETVESTGNSSEDSNDVVSVHSKPVVQQRMSPVHVTRGAKPMRQLAAPITIVPATTNATTSVVPALVPTITTTASTTQVCVTPPTPSRGKQMPLMLWHAPDMQSDESASCESLGELSDQRSMVASPASPKVENQATKAKNITTHSLRSSAHLQTQLRQNKSRRCAYISTDQMYCTRAWEDEEIVADGYEFMKEEVEALQADAPMLEIPKWTEHELTVSYCIEGTENLSDEAFLKRHEKLELAEKRRKKWDVQQIREQRRIEKLKRRHCKDEIQIPPDQQPLLSFYPQPDAIQTICFTNDLPVQAFGELVPKLSALYDFDLPWLDALNSVRTPGSAATGSIVTLVQSQAGASVSTAQGQQQLLNSTFVFVKKRKRQQSGTTGGAGGVQTTRQRGALRRAAAITATPVAATVTPEQTVIAQPAIAETATATATSTMAIRNLSTVTNEKASEATSK
uniref:Protein male-specific lethal-1 n=1 Tax=Zeugodacus cucurbitae TaxID=28588 RepID=A0A0A1WKM6_ZEUCU